MLKKTLRKHLRTKLSDTDLKQWFNPLTLHASETGGIAVTFPHPFFSEWLDGEKRFFEQALRNFKGNNMLSGILSKFSAFGSQRLDKSGQGMETLAFKSVLDHNGAPKKQPLQPESIMQTVGEWFGLSIMLLARQISIYLCRELLAFPAIGTMFGGKNHATVIYTKKFKNYEKVTII